MPSSLVSLSFLLSDRVCSLLMVSCTLCNPVKIGFIVFLEGWLVLGVPKKCIWTLIDRATVLKEKVNALL